MNILFFGNSILQRHPEKPMFVDMVYQHYGIDICSYEFINKFYSAIPGCSEERILFFLKKSVLDVAIIFHSRPTSIFFPSWFKDLRNGVIDKPTFEYLLKQSYRARFLYNLKYTNFDNINLDFDYSNCEIDDVDYDINDLVAAAKNYEDFFHPDLQFNRYCGALVQIDQYVTLNKIKTIHFINNRFIPSWFKFNSGIVNDYMQSWQYINPHTCSYSEWPNAITYESNKLIADYIINSIDQLNY